jgi:hypothetical protein
VLRLQGAQLPRELLEGRVGLLPLEVARLLEGREGVVYAGYCDLVWADVEVLDCVVDELGWGVVLLAVPRGWGWHWSYSCWILFEKHLD